MIEKMRQSPHEQITAGCLVKLRDSIDAEVMETLARSMQPGIAYRVLSITHHDDEGGDAAWLGPTDMTDQDVATFDPLQGIESVRKEFESRVFPIAASYLRRVLD